MDVVRTLKSGQSPKKICLPHQILWFPQNQLTRDVRENIFLKLKGLKGGRRRRVESWWWLKHTLRIERYKEGRHLMRGRSPMERLTQQETNCLCVCAIYDPRTTPRLDGQTFHTSCTQANLVLAASPASPDYPASTSFTSYTICIASSSPIFFLSKSSYFFYNLWAP